VPRRKKNVINRDPVDKKYGEKGRSAQWGKYISTPLGPFGNFLSGRTGCFKRGRTLTDEAIGTECTSDLNDRPAPPRPFAPGKTTPLNNNSFGTAKKREMECLPKTKASEATLGRDIEKKAPNTVETSVSGIQAANVVPRKLL